MNSDPKVVDGALCGLHEPEWMAFNTEHWKDPYMVLFLKPRSYRYLVFSRSNLEWKCVQWSDVELSYRFKLIRHVRGKLKDVIVPWSEEEEALGILESL